MDYFRHFRWKFVFRTFSLLKALLSLNYVLQGRNFYAILHGSFSMLVNLMILKNADPLLFGRQNPFLYKFFDVIR